jgi:hypothetical protein
MMPTALRGPVHSPVRSERSLASIDAASRDVRGHGAAPVIAMSVAHESCLHPAAWRRNCDDGRRAMHLSKTRICSAMLQIRRAVVHNGGAPQSAII